MDIHDLKEVIVGMGMTRERHLVLTGSLPAFIAKLDEQVGVNRTDPRKDPVIGTFMGIEIKEDSRLPANRAILKQGEEVVAVMNLDLKPTPTQGED